MNPFIMYVGAFFSAIALYLFNWSDLYCNLSIELMMFLIITGAISIYFSIKTKKEKIFYYYDIKKSKKIDYIIIANLCLFALDFIYAKQIPLFNVNNYLEFSGIPTVHVFIYTFNIFLGVYLFHELLSEFNYKNIIRFLIPFIPAIFLVSRGMVMNILIGAFCILIMKYGKSIEFYKKNCIKITIALLSCIFLFGVFGNLRNNNINKSPNKFSSDYIMQVGGASSSFRESIIPKEFFWGYIYISSPLANLQKTIVNIEPKMDFEKLFTKEILLDSISKRIVNDNGERSQVSLISPTLTASTMFVGAYYYAGWYGMTIMFLVLILGSYLYIKILSDENPFKICGIAMLCNLVALCAFANMINFSGMSFQLMYPVFVEIYIRLKDKGVIQLKNKIKR